MNNFRVSNKMIKDCTASYYQCTAKMNRISSIKFELFYQKYGRYPQLIEIWDFDTDIEKASEKIVNVIDSILAFKVGTFVSRK